MKPTPLAKILRLHPRDWRDLAAAQIALLRAQLLVWTRRRGALVTPVRDASVPPAPPPPPPRSGGDAAVRRIALAVSRAADYGLFRPSCLVRAVALHAMLHARGFSGSSVRVGVRREHGNFLAHAWVDYRGSVLADHQWRVGKFAELARMGLSGAP